MAMDHESAFHAERERRLQRLETELDRKASAESVTLIKEAADEARALVTVTNDKQFDHLNNLRRDMATKEQLAPLVARLEALENWRAKATGVAAVLTVFAGLIGAAIVKALGG